ncbi:aldose 1-epimerase family protein [Sphingomonas oligophenolica]|uniref:Aldose 1-epimerase family protein n=1 Tax=Sphingomonas oligophenolica TaxID=301154 RepID=A0A502CP29_9SPHN|nr:aldose 1-epimerase family protein [Sphingomonas oligophenolica]TPG13556.1 aldose 1-epimerase family protein [Sphingomonas oligophenolica]
MGDLIHIATDQLSAAINPLGAELWSLRDAAGRELMTDADPAYWTGHAPILFPVVGRPYREEIRADCQAYPMAQHGFARTSLFELIEHSATRAVFALADSDETRRHYPFAFRLEIAFAIQAATLSVDVRVINPGDVALPASFGFHPAFAWPLPYGHDKLDHRIVFAADEPDRLCEIAKDGTIAAETRASPLDGRTLQLRDDLFTNDALVWNDIRSDHVVYGAGDGPSLRVDFPDTPKLGIWTKPGAHYICVEPWHGIADPEGFTGDIRDKPGIFTVAPGDEERIALRVTLVA